MKTVSFAIPSRRASQRVGSSAFHFWLPGLASADSGRFRPRRQEAWIAQQGGAGDGDEEAYGKDLGEAHQQAKRWIGVTRAKDVRLDDELLVGGAGNAGSALGRQRRVDIAIGEA